MAIWFPTAACAVIDPVSPCLVIIRCCWPSLRACACCGGRYGSISEPFTITANGCCVVQVFHALQVAPRLSSHYHFAAYDIGFSPVPHHQKISLRVRPRPIHNRPQKYRHQLLLLLHFTAPERQHQHQSGILSWLQAPTIAAQAYSCQVKNVHMATPFFASASIQILA